MRWLVTVSFIVTSALLVYVVALRNAILDRLRDRHPEQWQALGAPALRGGLLSRRYRSRSDSAYDRFLRERRYEALGDPEFSAMVRRAERLDRWVWWGVGVLMLSYVAWQLSLSESADRVLPGAPVAPAHRPPAPPGEGER